MGLARQVRFYLRPLRSRALNRKERKEILQRTQRKSLDYGFERTGHWICILLAFQNKNTARTIISGSMACL